MVSGKVPDDRWEPNDSLTPDDCQGRVCYAMSRNVPDDY